MTSNEIWLLQAGTWKSQANENEESFDKYIDFSYMGAAEYEIAVIDGEFKNPLYLSIERMFLKKEDYDFYPLPKRKDAYGNQLYIYCKKDMVEELKPFVREVLDGKHRTKNGPRIRYVKATTTEIEKYKKYKMENFWWDIEHDFFIFYGNDKIEKINESFESFFEHNKEKLLPKMKKNEKRVSFIKNFVSKLKEALILKEED